jgi:molybdopterin-containing oxidoreductase family membrane subunit
MNTNLFRRLIVPALIGLAFGVYGMYERLAFGLTPVAFGSYVPWGLWVSFYLFFLGLSAGAFLITILTYVLNLKHFEGIGPLSAFVVLISLFCELQFILLDLGSMYRAFYQFFLTPSFSSLMTWMFVLFNAMLLIYAVKTFLLIRGGLIRRANENTDMTAKIYGLLSLGQKTYTEEMSRKDNKWVHILAWISLPVGLLFYGANGAFFAILMNRPIWNSALTPLLFVVAALLSGGALVTFLIYILKQKDPLNPEGVCREDTLCLDLGKVILFLLSVFLVLEGMQFFVGYQTATTNIVTSLDLMVKGQAAWVFWFVHLLIGSLIPLALLVFGRHSSKAVSWACFLIFVTFIAVRYNFVVSDLAVYKLEGLETAFIHSRLTTHYVPNLNEWMVSVWIISSGLIAFVLGIRYLPVLAGWNGGKAHE